MTREKNLINLFFLELIQAIDLHISMGFENDLAFCVVMSQL